MRSFVEKNENVHFWDQNGPKKVKNGFSSNSGPPEMAQSGLWSIVGQTPRISLKVQESIRKSPKVPNGPK